MIDYLTRFNEETIMVVNPNHKMFMIVFQIGLKASNFNESLTKKIVNSMKDIMAWVEFYIKGAEINEEK